MPGEFTYHCGMNDLMRHIDACRNARLPGGRLRLHVASEAAGWLQPGLVAVLQRFGATLGSHGVTVTPGALPGLGRHLADEGLCHWRNEAFDVRGVLDGPALAQVDRGALPLLGIRAAGVHLNGLVQRADGPWLWVARRAADKRLDPNKLDHLVAGGVPARLNAWETLAKEASEEASIPAALITTATPVAVLSYAMDRPEGLRRDRLHCYDLLLPPDFVPVPADGEVAGFELWPLPAVLDHVRHTDAFKFNVGLVLIDLFIRQGLVEGDEAAALRAALDAPSD